MAFTGNSIRFDVDTGYAMQVQVVADEYNCSILKEVYYVVSWGTRHSFIVAYNFDKHHLEIQGTAPYLAREYETYITDVIQDYNDGLR